MIIPIAKIGAPHGLHGRLKINWIGKNLALYKEVEVFYLKASDKQQWQQIKCTIDWISNLIALFNVSTREQAKSFTNSFLGIDRSFLPTTKENEFYICDLIGLEVYNQNEQFLGTIYDVLDNRAHPILHLKNPAKPDIFVPFIKEFVIIVDTAKVIVDWEANYDL